MMTPPKHLSDLRMIGEEALLLKPGKGEKYLSVQVARL